MRLHTIIFTAIALLAFAAPASAQMQKVYQLSGLVVNKDTKDPVPYASIHVNRSRRGSITSREGFYSIPVVEGDTIYFTCLGYHPGMLVFSKYLEDYKGDVNSTYIYSINYLVEDSIDLPGLVIFPYNTASELRTAIIETDIPENIESINARDNLNPEVLDVLMDNLKVDEGERIMVARQLYYNQHQQKNIAPTMTLFDPLAVYQLLKYINNRTKARKNKDLDYWSE